MLKFTILCNKCGDLIKDSNHVEDTEYFHYLNTWGFFGVADTRTDEFDLCHRCYQTLIQTFKINVFD